MNTRYAVLIGTAASLACTALWHSVGGAGERLATTLDRQQRIMLDDYEMQVIDGRAQRDPIARRIVMKGPANDFQRAELVRYSERLPGVGEARWNRAKTQFSYPLPSLVEGIFLALSAFVAGLLVAYAAFVRREDAA